MKLLVIFFLLLNSLAFSQATKKKYKKRKYYKKKRVIKKKVKSSSLALVESTRHFISSGWIGFNHDLDMFFSGQRYSKTKNKSRILLSYAIQKTESVEVEKGFDFGLKIHLPKLSKKLSVVIEKQRDEIIEAQTSQAEQSVNIPERGYTAGVKYLVKKTPFFTSSLDTGIRLKLPLDPFAKLKFFKFSEFDWLNIYFGQKFIYYRQEGYLRTITELNFSKALSNTMAISQGNALTWTDESDQFNLRNSISLSQVLTTKSAMSYSVGANAIFKPVTHYTSYDASVSYRRKLYKDWLTGSTAVGAVFQKSNDFNMINYVSARIDALLK